MDIIPEDKTFNTTQYQQDFWCRWRMTIVANIDIWLL